MAIRTLIERQPDDRLALHSGGCRAGLQTFQKHSACYVLTTLGRCLAVRNHRETPSKHVGSMAVCIRCVGCMLQLQSDHEARSGVTATSMLLRITFCA